MSHEEAVAGAVCGCQRRGDRVERRPHQALLEDLNIGPVEKLLRPLHDVGGGDRIHPHVPFAVMQ